jgi:hypothetical protein
MYSAAIRSPALLIAALVVAWAAPANAQDARFAADRFSPSERGSEWFANESLGFHGPKPIRVGVVSSYGEKLFSVRDSSGARIGSPLRNDCVLHLGADATVFDFVRIGLDLPFQAVSAGHTVEGIRSPDRAQGLGDLRFGADARVIGKDQGPFRLAVGAQFWAPIGEQKQWESDGTWRVRPRVMAAGDDRIKPHFDLVWSGQAGVDFRDRRVGTDIGLSGAVGIRMWEQLVVGPEFFTSTVVNDGAFKGVSTPFELMIGSHWLIAHTIRIGAGIGRGFARSDIDPNYRITAVLEYAPEFGPPQVPSLPPPLPPTPPPPPIRDDDHDGVRDDQDACPAVAGIPTYEPATNGCPPDTDGDGINDLGDACPTQPGPASPDPAKNGCPLENR